MASGFYFTRHGQTVWNVENKICGATDSPLTDHGRDQARALGKRIAADEIHIDEILASPLSRAYETALLIGEMTGIPVHVEERLREQNFGKYEGAPRNSREFAKAKASFVYRYEGGESMLKLCHRVYDLLDEIRADESGRVYLLVAHNGISRAVESYFHDMTNQDYAAFRIANCELKYYRF